MSTRREQRAATRRAEVERVSRRQTIRLVADSRFHLIVEREKERFLDVTRRLGSTIRFGSISTVNGKQDSIFQTVRQQLMAIEEEKRIAATAKSPEGTPITFTPSAETE